MTEDQRYGGKNYVGKVMKGQKKQDEWINKLQDLITNSKFNRDIENYLNRILKYDNIPRKKIKFLNFIKASIVKDDKIAEKLWTIIEQTIKPVQQELQNGNTENKSANIGEANKSANNESFTIDNKSNCQTTDETNDANLKRKIDDYQNSENKKVKIESKTSPDELSVDQTESINKVIENLIERSKETQTLINPIKLTKKILKRKENHKMQLKKFKKLIRRLGPYTEFKELAINEFYEKFIQKLSSKDCFQIDQEMIAYKI